MVTQFVPHAVATRVVITGGPGAGKTTLLGELAAMGYATVEESARAIIAERVASGASPRPDPAKFAREILRRDVQKYLDHAHASQWVFFDRGVIEALAMTQEVSPLPARELEAMLAEYAFHRSVFVLPPWENIYATDEERDQSFAEAVAVHARIVQWYTARGYALHEVPRLSAPERAAYVLRILSVAVSS
jgi:predicted ATPase